MYEVLRLLANVVLEPTVRPLVTATVVLDVTRYYHLSFAESLYAPQAKERFVG